MINFSTSKQLIKNVKQFVEIKRYSLFDRVLGKSGIFYGWGKKRSGLVAINLAKKRDTQFMLLEDGFIRSIGLGSAKSPSFSIIEDSVGIYYDATSPSALENILNSYDFALNTRILGEAREAISLISKHNISKYNYQKDIKPNFFKQNGRKRVLIIAQTKDDTSLRYGLASAFSTREIIDIAREENAGADIYIKIHPEALKGNKSSDIQTEDIPPFCKPITDDVNPISLLKQIDKVYTKTSQMGFEALLLGKECVCFGMPFYAGWGVSDDRVKCERRARTRSVEEIFAAAYILYSRYRDPYKNKPLTLIQTIQTVAKIKSQNLYKKAFFFGFSRWKHGFVRPFFLNEKFEKLVFVNPIFSENYLNVAQKYGLDENSLIYIWGKKSFGEVEKFAKKNSIPIYRVEDGFIRSVELGSDLTRAYSLVVDKEGIYFDATQKSALEEILNTAEFDKNILKEARDIQTFLTNRQISKYNIGKDEDIKIDTNKKVLFAVGQVDDDASIRYGSEGMSNLALLKAVRERNPQSYIIYKPHPDVLAKNRIGLSDNEALRYADKIVKNTSIDSIFRICDEVHTITSLVGFEALLRGKNVITYGMPFYAGWGLTCDTLKNERRTRKLTLHELIAGVLIAYPRYISPKTNTLCDIKTFLDELELARMRYNTSRKITNKFFIFCLRKAQALYRIFKR